MRFVCLIYSSDRVAASLCITWSDCARKVLFKIAFTHSNAVLKLMIYQEGCISVNDMDIVVCFTRALTGYLGHTRAHACLHTEMYTPKFNDKRSITDQKLPSTHLVLPNNAHVMQTVQTGMRNLRPPPPHSLALSLTELAVMGIAVPPTEGTRGGATTGSTYKVRMNISIANQASAHRCA
jgi:hypothetical protein